MPASMKARLVLAAMQGVEPSWCISCPDDQPFKVERLEYYTLHMTLYTCLRCEAIWGSLEDTPQRCAWSTSRDKLIAYLAGKTHIRPPHPNSR